MLPLSSARDIGKWERLDDVIMGGQSSSRLEASTTGAVWSGELILEGGGFCGTRRKVQKFSSVHDAVLCNQSSRMNT